MHSGLETQVRGTFNQAHLFEVPVRKRGSFLLHPIHQAPLQARAR